MAEEWSSATVDLTVPAHEDFVSAIRVQARWVALRTDLGLDDVDDLQMAIGEAATLLLAVVDPSEARFRVTFAISPTTLHVVVCVRSRPGAEIDRAGLAWLLLTALDPDVVVASDDGETAIRLTRTRANSPQ
jgi:hypothetical protein